MSLTAHNTKLATALIGATLATAALAPGAAAHYGFVHHPREATAPAEPSQNLRSPDAQDAARAGCRLG